MAADATVTAPPRPRNRRGPRAVPAGTKPQPNGRRKPSALEEAKAAALPVDDWDVPVPIFFGGDEVILIGPEVASPDRWAAICRISAKALYRHEMRQRRRLEEWNAEAAAAKAAGRPEPDLPLSDPEEAEAASLERLLLMVDPEVMVGSYALIVGRSVEECMTKFRPREYLAALAAASKWVSPVEVFALFGQAVRAW